MRNGTTKFLSDDLGRIDKGINKAASVVKSTMGAKGKNVIIFDEGLRFTKDGVTVAKSIKLEDPIENIGAQLLINSAQKTVDQVGDGTTLTSLLLQSFLSQSKKFIDSDTDIKEVIEEMEVDINTIVETLSKEAIPLKTFEEIEKIATVSSNSERIGKLIADCYRETGFNSFVTVEKTKHLSRTTYEVTQGLSFGSGLLSTAFETEPQRCILHNPYIIIEEQRLTNPDKYIQLYDKCIKNDEALVIIAEGFSTEFMLNATRNILNAGLQLCLIESPGFGANIKENYKDIEAFVNEEGKVDKFVGKPAEFILYNEDTPYLEERIEELKLSVERAEEDFYKDNFIERIHALAQSSGVIFVGGTTEASASEEYDRVEDALGAVKSAISSGYVAGGGYTFFNYQRTNLITSPIVKRAMQEPIRQILKNANISPALILDNAEIENKGYNVATDNFEDLIETGIIDPVDVLTNALKNAFASFKLYLNTKFVLYNEKIENGNQLFPSY